MAVFDNDVFGGHEAVHYFTDAASGLRCIIAIHSTALGPAAGGCRFWHYATEDNALRDALRLSQGMSYKNAIADLPFGGGKAVILANPERLKSGLLFEAFGRAVESLAGRYITAEDVGVKLADMQAVARTTQYVSGLPKNDAWHAGGDPSPKTAYGVFLAILATVKHRFSRDDLAGLKVAVQGVGGVGWHLCQRLHDAGAKLLVADLDRQAVSRAQDEFKAEAVPADEILFQDVEVLAPCALGGVFGPDTINALSAGVIAGAANNQLAGGGDGRLLMQRNILYAPDFVINAGGIINVAAEYLGCESEAEVMAKIEHIPQTLEEIFERSAKEETPTDEIAIGMAQAKIAVAVNT